MKNIRQVQHVSLGKTFFFPKDIFVQKWKDVFLIIHKRAFSWIVLDKEEFDIFRKLQEGLSVGECLLRFRKEIVIGVVTQIFAKKFENPPVYAMSQEKLAQVHLTNACNLRCNHCYMYSGKAESSELSLDEWLFVIEDFSKNGGTAITFTGGEVAVLPNVCRIFERAHDLGLRVSILTNGILWSVEDIKRISMCADHVQISIDGYDRNTYMSVRNFDGFDTAMRAVREFSDAGVPVTIATTPLYDISAEWEIGYLQFARRVLSTIPKCSIKLNDDLMDGRLVKEDRSKSIRYKEVSERLTKTLLPATEYNAFLEDHAYFNIRNNCGLGNVTISSTGNVYWCDRIFDLKTRINVRTHGFKEIFEMAETVRRKTSVEHFEPCGKCDLKYICGGACRLRYCLEMRGKDLLMSDIEGLKMECPLGQKQKILSAMVALNEKFFLPDNRYDFPDA